ncbi:MAG: lipopolysaccharide heptosyltransferase II [Syntrophales bacterium LBB04]|nr:lipopolysaccharide heptosyltransferase II [Syntrophales bacterium LBB04]
MNILIVKLSAIGDVVHTLPSLSALRKLYPNAHISWVIEDDASDLIIDHPCLDQVIVSHRKRWIREIKEGKASAVKEIRQFLTVLRGRRYDLVIDFHGLMKSSLIVLMAKAKRKLGYDSMQELSGLFVNEKISEDKGKHAVSRYLDFIRYLAREDITAYEDVRLTIARGINNISQDVQCLIPIKKKEEEKIRELLKLKEITGRKFVAVNPVALWETKLWEDEKFAKLGDMIAEQYGLPVVFTGMDKARIDHILDKMNAAAINLAGETSLRELACLYRQAEVVITTDSGPMHIAAAMETPVVALFGPTDPVRTGPFGKNHIVIRKNISCSPCFKKKCSTKKCMQQIEVEEVFQAVESLINGKLS